MQYKIMGHEKLVKMISPSTLGLLYFLFILDLFEIFSSSI